MEVFVNDEKLSIDDNASILDVLNQSGIVETKGLAVAINNEVVSKTEWDSASLQPADKIMIIRATQGG